MEAAVKPPRICLITTSYPQFSGDDSSIFVKRLVDGLSQNGASGLVLVPSASHRTEEISSAAFPVSAVNYAPKKLSITRGSGIMPTLKTKPWLIPIVPLMLLSVTFSAWHKRKSFDCLLCHWLPSAIPAWLLSALLKKPYVAMVIGSDRLILKSYIAWLFYPALRRAKAITSENDEILELIKQKFPKLSAKVYKIQNGIDLEAITKASAQRFAARYALDPAKQYLLFVGRVVREKGIEHLISYLASVPEYHLLICGRTNNHDYLEKLKQLADKKKVTSRLHFLGAVNSNEIFDAYKLACCYVSASETEGRPNAVLEAMAAGCPVLLSDIRAHQELVGEGEERGSLLRGSFAESLAELLTNQSKIERAKAFTRGQSWSKTAEAYIKLLLSQ